MTVPDVPDEWTPDLVAAELQQLAGSIIRLGTVDWVALVTQDETPASGMTRVTTLVNAAGMLGSLAMAAQVTMDDLFTGMVAAALAGTEPTAQGETA